MKNTKFTRIFPFIIWGIWLAIVFYFLEQNAEDSSQLSGALVEFLMRVFRLVNIDERSFEHIIRKLAHFSAFTGSGILGLISFRMLSRKVSLAILIPLHAALAALSELLQTLAEGRCCSVIDMLIDFGGGCLGIALCALYLDLLRKRIAKRDSI